MQKITVYFLKNTKLYFLNIIVMYLLLQCAHMCQFSSRLTFDSCNWDEAIHGTMK